MAITTTNPLQRADDDTIIVSSFIRIVACSILDKNEGPATIIVHFNIYSSKEKWIADWLGNKLNIIGIGLDSNFIIPYSREANGIDITKYLYEELLKHLFLLFPDWLMENIFFILPEPILPV